MTGRRSVACAANAALICLALSACGGGGDSQPAQQPAQPTGPAPLGAFTLTLPYNNASQVGENDRLRIMATGSGPAVRYEWDFGDGSAATSTEALVEHQYATYGPVTIKVKISDAAGNSTEAALPITVMLPDARPQILVAGESMPHMRNGDLQLSAYIGYASRAIPASTRFQWDFGDGTGSAEFTPVHRYAAAGSYRIALTVTDAQARQFSAHSDVTVREPQLDAVVSRLGGRGARDGSAALALFNGPTELAADADGSVWVSDAGNQVLRRIGTDDVVSTVHPIGGSTEISAGVGKLQYGTRITGGLRGAVYLADYQWLMTLAPDGSVRRIAPTTVQDSYGALNGLAVDASGSAYIAKNREIHLLKDQVLTRISGSAASEAAVVDGEAAQARFAAIGALAISDDGTLWIDDNGARLRRLRNGRVDTVLTATIAAGPAAGPGGAYIVTYDNGLQFISNDGNVRAIDLGGSLFAHSISGLTVDTQGRLWMTVQSDNTVKRLEPSGAITTFGVSAEDLERNWPGTGSNMAALGPGPITSLALHPNGRAYFITDRRLLSVNLQSGSLALVTGARDFLPNVDGPLATARLSGSGSPQDIVIDANGNIVFAEGCRIRRVDLSAGMLTSIAGGEYCTGQEQDGSGSAAALLNPNSLVADALGNVYALCDHKRVVRITPAGTVTTLYRVADGEEQIGRLLISPDGQLHVLRKGLHRLDAQGRLTLVAENPPGSMGLMVNEAGPAAFGPDGAVWAISTNDATLRRMSADKGVSSIVNVDGVHRTIVAGYPEWEFNPIFGALAIDSNGRIFLAGRDGLSLWRFSVPLTVPQ